MNSVGGLRLSEFLVGPSLTHEVALRNQLLAHCATSKSLPLSELLEVLERLSRQEDAREAVVDAARRLGPDVADVRSWLDAAICDATVPLCTRLQLHLLTAETVTPPGLRTEAASAFLEGVQLPTEALGLLGASAWVESIRRDAHLAAAALAAQLPAQALLDELASAVDDPLTPFLQRGLAHKKRANRRACLDICALVHGAPRCALLSLLATQQPLHLVAAATEPPPASLHDAAALLAVEHGDKRVADTVLLRSLDLSAQLVLGPLAAAALKLLGGGGAARHVPRWVGWWQRRALEVLGTMELHAAAEAASALAERGVACGAGAGVAVLLADWRAQPPSAPLPLPAPCVTRHLRRASPCAATMLAELYVCALLRLPPAASTGSPHEPAGVETDLAETAVLPSLLELLLCTPPSAPELPLPLRVRVASCCLERLPPPKHSQLETLAASHPRAVIEALRGCDAATALWAVAHLSGVLQLCSGAQGFVLRLRGAESGGEGGTECECGATTWAAARAACAAQPQLAAAYPRSDPEYAAEARPALLALGPAAAAHATSEDAQLFLHWAGMMTAQHSRRDERLEWLRHAARVLWPRRAAEVGTAAGEQGGEQGGGAGGGAGGEEAEARRRRGTELALQWGLSAGTRDQPVLCAALEALEALGEAKGVDGATGAEGGAELFGALLPVVAASRLVAAKAVALLRGRPPRAADLELVLASSTVSSALGAAQLCAPQPHPPTLAALAVRGAAQAGSAAPSTAPSTADGGDGGRCVHPSVHLAHAAPRLPFAVRAAVLTQLLAVELPQLPEEGSPSGAAHRRHVRLWLCVGSIVSTDAAFAPRVAAAAEATLEAAALPETRVVLQNVYARAVWASLHVPRHSDSGEPAEAAQDAAQDAAVSPLERLVSRLAAPALRLQLATPLLAVAAQLLLHPDAGGPGGSGAGAVSGESGVATAGVELRDCAELRPLLATVVGWSLSYAPKPRFLAMLTLYLAMERNLVGAPGWYLKQLRQFVAENASFARMREKVQLDAWVSEAWAQVSLEAAALPPLELAIERAQRAIARGVCGPPEAWLSAEAEEGGEGGAEGGAEGEGQREEGSGGLPDEPSHIHEIGARAVTSHEPSAGYQRRPGVASRMPNEAGRRGGAASSGAADVVVVGSLLDNVPNMAGLVRTTEALLGASGEVTLRNDKVLSDAHFLKMSVAAEKSCAVRAVPEGPRLAAFLREKRSEGYAVLALEQTSTSVMLGPATPLPKRVVLVVGSEAHGVPAWLLHSGLIDGFLELRLLGQTQSLNAHVATAMLLWHYCLQHHNGAP